MYPTEISSLQHLNSPDHDIWAVARTGCQSLALLHPAASARARALASWPGLTHGWIFIREIIISFNLNLPLFCDQDQLFPDARSGSLHSLENLPTLTLLDLKYATLAAQIGDNPQLLSPYHGCFIDLRIKEFKEFTAQKISIKRIGEAGLGRCSRSKYPEDLWALISARIINDCAP